MLADFDVGARRLLGMTAEGIYRGARPRRILEAARAGAELLRSLPEMPDARLLFDAVKHLKPTILTGLPLGNWAAPQKIEWAAEHFPGRADHHLHGPRQAKHMDPGDVLVDDRENHRAAYEEAGVVFVHHRNAADSLRQLAKIFPSVKGQKARA